MTADAGAMPEGTEQAASVTQALTAMEAPGARPVGWWLKEADRRLDAAFERALGGRGADRRRWQVLAALAEQPLTPAALIASLAAFDQPSVIDRVISGLSDRGWVQRSGGLLQLTEAGRREHTALLGAVTGIRRQIATALPAEEYDTLLRLLGQLIDALEEPRTGS